MDQPKRRLKPWTVAWMVAGGFLLLFFMISGAVFLSRGESGRWSDGRGASFFSKSEAIAVLEIKGVIMDSRKTLERLKELEESEWIRGVVLRLDSPGGSVAPSQEIYEAVKRFPKPLVVSMGSIAASGAFYIACGSKKVYANPGTLTGSIGVIIQMANLSKLYQWAKVDRYSIKAGKYKDAGADYRPLTDEERALFQETLDDVMTQFKQAVAEGRGLSAGAVDEFADGRIFTGAQALKLKVVDELGGIQEAIQDAAIQAGIKGKPRVLYRDNRRNRILEMFLDSGADEESVAPGKGVVGAIRVVGQALGLLNNSGGEPVMPGLFWLWNGAS